MSMGDPRSAAERLALMDELARKHGLSAYEWLALASLKSIGPAKPESMCDWMITEGICVPDFSASACEAAVQRCISRGHVVALTAEDCLRDRARWLNEDSECCSDREYRVGFLDFTEHGARVYAAIDSDIARALNRRRYNVGWQTRERAPGNIAVFACDERDVRRGCAVVSDPESGHCKSVLKVIGPRQIGPWWVTRFHQIESGWRADIVCVPHV